MYVEEWRLNSITAFQNSISLHSLAPFSQAAFSRNTHLMYPQGTYEMKEMKTCVAVEIQWTKLILYCMRSAIHLLLIAVF
jgi:hypothetical protein